MDAHAAKHPTPEHSLIINNKGISIKRLSTSKSVSRKTVVITKCLCDPCPRLYTDIFKMILIICKDSSHKDNKDFKINPKIQHFVEDKTLSYNISGSNVYDFPNFEQYAKERDES